jgi:hypothetical protein
MLLAVLIFRVAGWRTLELIEGAILHLPSRAFPSLQSAGLRRRANRSNCMAWFYEIRDSGDAVLKRDGGFATQDAAKIAGRADAKKMKNSRQPNKPEVGTIMVGQNAEKPTRR